MSSVELIDAVRAGATGSVKAAIEAGADVNQQDANGWTPLCWAAGKGELATIELLLAHGADVRKTGRDHRTPSMIAVAAGRVDAARLLRETEAKVASTAGADPVSRTGRRFCKAYRVDELRAFAGWPESAPPDGAQVLYLHPSLQVTRSMWADQDVVFESDSPEWRQFCRAVLAFDVPDDLQLIGHG